MTTKEERLSFLEEMKDVRRIKKPNRAEVQTPRDLTPGHLERQRAAVAKAVKDSDTHEVFLHNHERKLKELKRQVSELENLVQICTEAVIQSGRGAGVSDRQTWEMMQGQ